VHGAMSDKLPRVYDSGQLSLFPTAPRDLCKRLGLSWWAAGQLFKESLISFDPEEIELLDEPQMAELTFVGSLVAANCPGDILHDLLSTLIKPYCYSHNTIYYHWPSSSWKKIPEQPEEEDGFSAPVKWELIPKFPVRPEGWDLFAGLSRKSEEYSAAYQWMESLLEAEELDTLADMRTYIDQLLQDATAKKVG
jgi:hypothetical protein